MRDTIPAPCLRTPRAIIAAALLVVACALGGCAAGGAASGSFAMASGGSGATVAFEVDRRSAASGVRPHGQRARQRIEAAEPVDRVARRRGFLPRAQLSLGAGGARQDHDRLGLGRLRQQPAARAAALRRGSRPARPDATPGPRPTIWCCGKSRKRASPASAPWSTARRMRHRPRPACAAPRWRARSGPHPPRLRSAWRRSPIPAINAPP